MLVAIILLADVHCTFNYLFLLGVEKGFYARVSRLGTQWLELDLHFLSLGGGEIALGWWFEECLVPYLVNTSKLEAVQSISIVTGYGKTRLRGARQGDDGMRKRVRAMLEFMNIEETPQPNRGRVHIDKPKLIEEVKRNNGRIIFDYDGYVQFKERETTANKFPDAEQKVRPRYRPADPHIGGPPFIRVETESTSPEFRQGNAHAPHVEHVPPAEPNAPENFDRRVDMRGRYPDDQRPGRYERDGGRRDDSYDRRNSRHDDRSYGGRGRQYDSTDRRGGYDDYDRRRSNDRYDSRRGGRPRGDGYEDRRYNDRRDPQRGGGGGGGGDRFDNRDRRSSSHHGDDGDRRRPDDGYGRPGGRDDRYDDRRYEGNRSSSTWEPPVAVKSAAPDVHYNPPAGGSYDDRDRRDYQQHDRYAEKYDPGAPVKEDPTPVENESDGKKRGYQQTSRGYNLETSVTKRSRIS